MKEEIIEETVPEIRSSFPEVPVSEPLQIKAASAIPTKVPKQVMDASLQVKQELLSPPVDTQTQIDTDHLDSDSEIKVTQPARKRKMRTRRRINRIESESDDETPNISNPPRKKPKNDIQSPKQTATVQVVPEAKSENLERDNDNIDEKKVSDMKNLIKKLSEGETKNPESLLQQFEAIVGKEGVSTLRALLNCGSSNTNHEDENGTRNDSGSDDEPLIKQKAKKENKKQKTRKRKTEAEKLTEDIMEMYIKDGVLSAKGLRHHRRIPYVEDDISRDFETDETTEDDESVNCQKGSSTGDRSEKALNETDQQSESEVTIPLELKRLECRVVIDKLPIGLSMPVKINSDGTIKEQHKVNSEVKRSESHQQTESQQLPKSSVKFETSPSVETLHNVSNCVNEVNKVMNGETKPPVTPNDNIKAKFGNILTKNESPSPSKIILSMEKTVCNLSFVQCRTGVMLKCNSEKCSFERTNHQLFQYHIQTRHLLVKWSGSCILCKRSVSGFGSLLDEYNHMYTKHILRDNGLIADKAIKDNDIDGKTKKNKKRKRKKRNQIIPTPETIKDVKSMKIPKTSNLTEAQNSLKTQTMIPEVASPRNSETFLSPTGVLEPISGTASTSLTTALVSNIEKPQIGSESVKNTVNTASLPTLEAANLTRPPIGSPSIKKYVMIHNIQKNITTEKKPDEASTTLASTETSNVTIESAVTKPPLILRLRILPGDKLSVIKNPSTQTMSQEHVLNKQSEETLNTMQREAITLTPTTSYVTNRNNVLISQLPQTTNVANDVNSTERLRPWLDVRDNKYSNFISSMLTEDCLVDLFKCMDPCCDYHTNDVGKFVSHLIRHNNQELESIGRCAYCNFLASSLTTLASHVQNEHMFDRYACTKCFYRSVVEHNVITHQMEFHKNETNTILDCVATKINYKEAVLAAVESRLKYILPILCVCKFPFSFKMNLLRFDYFLYFTGCKAKFFIYETFIEHYMKDHGNIEIRHRCNKCLEETNMGNLKRHLENCHNIKQFQCVLCRFGTDTLEKMKLHLANLHPSKLPFFCERAQTSKNHPSSIECLDLRLIGVRLIRYP